MCSVLPGSVLESLHLHASRGPLAAAADALGRVMLLDAASGAVLRVLKGALPVQVGEFLAFGVYVGSTLYSP